jgi:hypothetical protein
MEILNTLNVVKNVLQECLVVNFVPMKFEGLLAGKCGKGHLLNNIDYFYVPLFKLIL